jgi:hypothetical protein
MDRFPSEARPRSWRPNEQWLSLLERQVQRRTFRIVACQEVREPETLAELGKHKATKGCVCVKRLADTDLKAMIMK